MPDFGDICSNYHRGAETSVAAQNSSPKSERRRIRDQIAAVIAGSGAEGMTCEEVEDRLALAHQTASARISELLADELIMKSGR